MEKTFKAIEEVQDYLGLEPDNESMMELDMCKSGYVGFYDDKGTSVLLPFNEEGIDYEKIDHVVKIERNLKVEYPSVIQQKVVLNGVEKEFSISTTVIVADYNDLLPLLKACLKQFNKIKIDSRW